MYTLNSQNSLMINLPVNRVNIPICHRMKGDLCLKLNSNFNYVVFVTMSHNGNGAADDQFQTKYKQKNKNHSNFPSLA